MKIKKHSLPVIVFLALLTLMPVPRAYADTAIPPDSAKVFAAFKAATGGSAWDSVATLTEVSTVTQGGLSGVVEHWEDDVTGCYADHITMDGISSMDGFNGTQAWSADSAGNAHYQDSVSDVRGAITNSYMVENAFLFPNRHAAVFGDVQTVREGGNSFSVINIIPDGGDPIDLWFDNTRHNLVRTVEHTSSVPEITDFSDFRKAGNVVLSFVSKASDGQDRFDSTDVMTSCQVNAALPINIFTIPSASAVDYTINGGPHAVTVPFTFTNGEIMVPVKINGLGPFNAILDSGAQFCVTPGFAKSNNINYSGTLPGRGIGPKTVDMGVAKLTTLQIGDITLESSYARVLSVPLPRDNPLIGSEIFSRFVVNIDFDKMQLTLTPLSLFKFNGLGIGVPFHFDGTIPDVNGSIDGVSGLFEIDTGSANPVALFGPYIKSNSLTDKYHPIITATTSGAGIGGLVSGSVGWAKKISLGGVAETNCLIILSNAKHGIFSSQDVSGNVGMLFLARFNLTFDYGHQMIYFQPNSHYGDSDPQNNLGISFTEQRHGELVTYVFPGSAAAGAGIAPGDLITAVNGKSIGAGDGETMLVLMIQPVGTVLQLIVETNHTSRVLSVTLQSPAL
jgi:hypothetical protein